MTTPFQTFGQNLGNYLTSDTVYGVLSNCSSYHGTDISSAATCLTRISNTNDISYNKIGAGSVLRASLSSGVNNDFSFNTMYTYGGLTQYYSTNSVARYTEISNNFGILDNISTDYSFNALHTNNLGVYKDMKDKRSKLDIKMRELYGETTDNMSMYNSSIYMNITLTVLASSVIYLLFAKL